MAVLNRSMFRRPSALPPMRGPMPVVRETYPVVKRDSGSPQEGEKRATTFFEKLFDAGTGLGPGVGPYADSEQGNILDLREYGAGVYDITDPQFIDFIEGRYMQEGDTFQDGIANYLERLKADMPQRAEGSPPQGEMVEEQVDVENVGIMDGFKENNPEQVAEQVLVEGERSRKEIAESDTYDELMQAIRGDKLTEEDRREELASIVGEEDADRTPDSVLVLVQPVMQMMNTETANTGIAQIEDGSMQMPREPVGVANGGYMKSFPNQNLNIESLTASDNIDNRIMKNLQFENMNKGIMGYAMGGLVKPVQKFNQGKLVESFQSEYLPMYMGLKDYYLPSDDQKTADALMSLSKAGFMYGMGAKPEEAGMLFFDEVGKKGSKAAATEQAVKGQLASGALSSAVAADLAAKKNLANTKNVSIVKGDKNTSDGILALKEGFIKTTTNDEGEPQNEIDWDSFYAIYDAGSEFTYDGTGSLVSVKAAPKSTEGVSYIVTKDTMDKAIDIPESYAQIPGLLENIKNLPEGAKIFVDSNNKVSIDLPSVANKEAYWNKTKSTVEYYSDQEFEDLPPLLQNQLTTVGVGTTFVKMKKVTDDGEEIVDINIDEVRKYIKDGWTVVPNSTIQIEVPEGYKPFAQGGLAIRKRESGSPENGEEKDLSYYEGLIGDAEQLISEGVIKPAVTEADQSFFNSLYAATYDGINELFTLKQLIAADPSLVGYTGLFQNSLNKIAGVVNDLDNAAGDYVFPDDKSTALGAAMQYVTKPEIREVKSSIEQLSDAIADIMSLRGKRGTPESVRKRAEKRTDLIGMMPQEYAFGKVDKLTDFLFDKALIFGVLSGQLKKDEYEKTKTNLNLLRDKILNITPDTYRDKKTNYTIEDLNAILEIE